MMDSRDSLVWVYVLSPCVAVCAQITLPLKTSGFSPVKWGEGGNTCVRAAHTAGQVPRASSCFLHCVSAHALFAPCFFFFFPFWGVPLACGGSQAEVTAGLHHTAMLDPFRTRHTAYCKVCPQMHVGFYECTDFFYLAYAYRALNLYSRGCRFHERATYLL